MLCILHNIHLRFLQFGYIIHFYDAFVKGETQYIV
nr:MAG TPA: hypothetical protein [Caudoviricetes sp.]